ncbi:hypothetical protein POM88_025174 [Heracleum sosnowskyi]|uniref:Uncharacterized protein n=1 Tax=Heracleum sosnowskyi TaxID=360622 RepID=A0AAD8I6I7_9APIA|nr:hypothetical protein POM88_025174 [Heracleum sosnowskyi]
MDGILLPLVVFCYFLYTSITSFILSIVLLIRYTLSQFYGFFASRVDDDAISLYEGTVIHDRRHPVNHCFKTPIRFALIDLDRSSYIPPNHLSSEEARSIAGTNGPVLLLTMPPSVGYQRSPLSLYYCYDLQESTSKILKYCIAEVTNSPWGEQVQFMFNPNSDLVAKSLHISPFMDMLGDWHMKTKSPGNNLSVSILVKHPELGNYFTASLTAKKILFTSDVDYALFFWLKPQIGAILTYWQSFQLLLKNVQFLEHPKYKKPGYIEESLKAAQQRGCCMAFQRNFSDENAVANARDRWFSWKSVKRPWV